MLLPPLLFTALMLDGSAPPTPAFQVAAQSQVLHDQDAAGTRYALGRNYKMIFDATGAQYLPRFGSRAEKNLPLHFAFADAPLSITRTHDRVVLERESFTEIYDLGLDAVEQSFQIEHRDWDGDLVFRVPLATELETLEPGGAGLRFGRSDLGEVHYGDATILDAASRRVFAPSRRVEGGIEIVVPDAFLDRAVFPIVIDPVIETFTIDTGTDDMRNADVAYSSTNNLFVVVYERVQSAADTDLLQQRFDLAGNSLEQIALAASSDDERDPAIAYASGNFLTAWRNTTNSFFVVTRIKARNRLSASTTLGTTFDVSSALDNTESEPDVGATSQGTGFPFVITFIHVSTSPAGIDQSVVVTQTANSSAISATRVEIFSNSFDYFAHARVTQQVRFGGRWFVTYETEDNPLVGAAELDINGFLIDPATGLLDGLTFQVCDLPSNDDNSPDVGGDGVDLLVAWNSKVTGQDADLLGQRYRFDGALTKLGGTFSLSDLDHDGADTLEQLEPAIGFDGARFAVAYRESATGAGNFDIIASTFFATGTSPFSGTQLALEKRTALVKTSTLELEPAITSCGLDQAGLHFITWTQQISSTNRDVHGSLFSSLGTGADAVTVQTGCGAPEPGLFTSTQAVIGGSYQVIVSNTVSPLLFIGLPTNLPLCSGQAGCALGVSPLSVVPAPPIIQTTIPADPAILGVTFALQVIDLLPANATGTLCGPPKYSQKFRVSDTRVTTIR